MSHFIGLVFGNDIEAVLEPYNEALEVEPYIKYTKDEAINELREQMISQYEYAILERPRYENEGCDNIRLADIDKTIARGTYISYEDAWEVVKTWGYEIDAEENLLSTYNPNSKWDWYTGGGRWDGYLPLANRSEDDTDPIYENSVYKFEVDWDTFFADDLIPFCFITANGEWHESGQMGWWGMTTNVKDEESWEQEFKEYLNSIPEDAEITAVDFHI